MIPGKMQKNKLIFSASNSLLASSLGLYFDLFLCRHLFNEFAYTEFALLLTKSLLLFYRTLELPPTHFPITTYNHCILGYTV